MVHGRAQRGQPSDRTFNRLSGKGYVPPRKGDYDRAAAAGVTVRELLVETFGGLGHRLVELLQRGAEYRENKLTATEYDETTWSARTWMTFVMQRLSVAIQRSATFEISRALGFSMATDPRVD